MITLAEIENGIKYEQKQLHDLVDQIRKAGDENAKTEVEYRIAHAKARLTARASRDKITVGEVDDIALEICQAEYLAYMIADTNFTVLKEALRASQARLNGWQTLAASMRLNGA